MEYMHKIRKMLCKELEEYGDMKNLTIADVETIHTLTDTVKNLDKIAMLEGEGGSSYGMSYDDYSERWGRGRNARRDSMGRYSSDNGSSYDDYGDYDNYSERGGRYSRDDAKDHIMHKLGEMMSNADPKQREALEEAMQRIKRA